MATFGETLNGSVTKDTVADVTAKAQQETRMMVQTMLDATDKIDENSRAILEVQQKLFQNSFNLWKDYSQFYINFSVDAVQQTFDQALAVRERLGIIFENELKKMHELLTSEQKLTLDAAEVFQAQAQAASSQVTEMFTPRSIN